jgi:hemoglobin
MGAVAMPGSPIHRIIAESEITEDLVRRVMGSFYADVRADPALGKVFCDAIGNGDWSAHIEKVIRFWLTALRISRCYDNRHFMPAHVRHAQISPRLAPRWLELFEKSVDRFCQPKQAAAFNAVAAAMIENLELALARRDSGNA